MTFNCTQRIYTHLYWKISGKKMSFHLLLTLVFRMLLHAISQTCCAHIMYLANRHLFMLLSTCWNLLRKRSFQLMRKHIIINNFSFKRLFLQLLKAHYQDNSLVIVFVITMVCLNPHWQDGVCRRFVNILLNFWKIYKIQIFIAIFGLIMKKCTGWV